MRGTVIVGSEAHINNVADRVTSDHLIGSPLALASRDFAAKAWVKFDNLPALRSPVISWMQGSVNQVDCENKVATITDVNTGKSYEERYDYLIASTGLRRAWPVTSHPSPACSVKVLTAIFRPCHNL